MSRSIRAVVAVAAAAALALAVHVRRAMGARPAELRRLAMRSPHGRSGAFANREPGLPRPDLTVRQLASMLLGRTPQGSPPGVVPLVTDGPRADRAALAATWFGHASVLLEVDGRRVLVDPVWSERPSPVPGFGPRRLHAPPVALSAIGEVDVVLLSHDHYDHLDRPTITALARRTAAVFVVPIGVDAHLRAWGVPAHRIVQSDWDDVVEVAGLELTCLECRHFSGRSFRRNTTQWAAWKVAGPAHAVYVGGDTGPTEAHARSGVEHGPFDLTLLPIGAYSELWPDIHTTPEQAVAAHLDLKGGVMLPIHWATFVLGFHLWSEPADRALRAAEEQAVALVVPRPGQRLDLGELGDDAVPMPWWRDLDAPTGGGRAPASSSEGVAEVATSAGARSRGAGPPPRGGPRQG